MTEPMVRFREVSKVYASRHARAEALTNVSFEIGFHEAVGLLGPNGAGKTTALKCLTTLIRPTSGDITVMGSDVNRAPRLALSRMAAVLEGSRNTYWRLTPRENLDYFAALHGVAAARRLALIGELLERLGLADVASTPVRMLSRGMQQRVALGCAFVKDAPLLLLDEPTLGLDLTAQAELTGALRNTMQIGAQTMVISSHDMDIVQAVCTRVIIIVDGKIRADTTVPELLRVAPTHSVEIQVSHVLTDADLANIRMRWGPCSATTQNGQTTLAAALVDPRDLYGLLDVLRSMNRTVDRIGQSEPDLRDVVMGLMASESA